MVQAKKASAAVRNHRQGSAAAHSGNATPRRAATPISATTGRVVTVRLARAPKRDDSCSPTRMAVRASTTAAPESVAIVVRTVSARAEAWIPESLDGASQITTAMVHVTHALVAIRTTLMDVLDSPNRS